MKATIENIKEVILEADILTDVNEIVNDIPLSDQGIDSLDIVNVYLLLEEKFGIKIPDEDLKKISTLNSIIEYINSKI